MRRFAKWILLALMLVAAIPVAGRGAEPLRISGWRWPFNLHVMIERERGTYESVFGDSGVRIVDLQSGPKLMAAMAAGDLDIVQGVGDAAFLVAATAGIEARIIAVNSRSPKAFAVVANKPDVRTIGDLRGKKVAGLRGSVVHQVFLGALADEGMTEADVEFFPMPLATAASTLLAGRVDAALLVGSEISRAEAAGARVLADGEGRVRGLSFTLASKKLTEERPEVIARFLEMRRETLAYIAGHREEALRIAAEQTKQGEAAASEMLDMYDFACEIAPEDIESLEASQRYLLESGIVKKEIDIAGLIYR